MCLPPSALAWTLLIWTTTACDQAVNEPHAPNAATSDLKASDGAPSTGEVAHSPTFQTEALVNQASNSETASDALDALTDDKSNFVSAPLFHDADSRLDFVHDAGRLGNRELPETTGGGVAWLDFDRDGWLDLYVCQSGPLLDGNPDQERAAAANQLWRGDGATLTRVPGLAADTGYGQGVQAADLNGDGFCDLLALNWGVNGVWLNEAGAGFRDATLELGWQAETSWSVSAGVLDFDADGDLDVYIANYLDVAPAAHLDPALNPDAHGPHKGYPHPDRYPAQHDVLWRNDGARMTNISATSGIAEADPQKGLGVIPTDVELDGWVDLYVANDATPNMLLHNQAGARFVEAGREMGLAYNESGNTEAGMGVDTVDVEGDGDLDLFVTNLDMETNSLYLNRSTSGRLTFRDQTLRMGLSAPSRGFVGFGTLFSDVDLDGDSDVLVVNGHVVDNIEEVSDTRLYAQPNQIYLNDGSGHFSEAPAPSLAPGYVAKFVSRGSALGDLDRDGDLDLAVANNNQATQIFLGTPPDSPALCLRLVGPGLNTEGLGASVWVHTKDGPTWLGRMERSKSYASSSEALIVLGLAKPLDFVEVLWPGGRRQTYRDLKPTPNQAFPKRLELTLRYAAE